MAAGPTTTRSGASAGKGLELNVAAEAAARAPAGTSGSLGWWTACGLPWAIDLLPWGQGGP